LGHKSVGIVFLKNINMNLKAAKIVDSIYYNLWFIPAVMVLVTIIIGGVILHLEKFIELDNLTKFFGEYINSQGLQVFFSVTASASITITSVTFSITVLTLSIASNHLGARLVPNFIRQKITQVFLGVLISTFVFSLFILQSHSSLHIHLGALYLAATFCIILIIISIFLFIFFINFICHIIQLDNILEFLLNDLMSCINRFIIDSEKELQNHSQNKRINFKESDSLDIDVKKYYKLTVKSNRYGYIQSIDYTNLFELAEKYSLIVRIDFRIGKFVLKNMPIVTIYLKSDLSDSLKKAISNKCLQYINLGHRRLSIQDIEFLFEELSEIALIALSPSVNNPYTAKHCIDRFIQGIETLSNYKLPRGVLCNNKGQIRIIRDIVRVQDIINSSFIRLRQQIKYDAFITLHTLKMINNLFKTNIRSEIITVLKKQSECLYNDILTQNINNEDLKLITEQFEIIKTK